MNIKCDQCNTEYEFDDNRVTDKGLNVKCSSCGHEFRIRKKSVVTKEQTKQASFGASQTKTFKIKRTDGMILNLSDMATIQKWIVEKKIKSADQLSMNGQKFQPLGAVSDLAIFFHLMEQAEKNTQQNLSNPDIGRPEPSLEPSSWEATSSHHPEDDVVDKWKRRGRRKWYVLALLFIIIAAAVTIYFLYPDRFLAYFGGQSPQTGEPAAIKQTQTVASKLQPNDPIEELGAELERAMTADSDPSLLAPTTDKLLGLIAQPSQKPSASKTTRIRLAKALIRLKRTAEARKQLNFIAQIEPDDIIQKLLQDLNASEEEDKPTKPTPTDSKPETPASYDQWISKADRLQRAGRTAVALNAYKAALEYKPSDCEALTGKGLCLLDLGNNSAAISAFQKALKSNARYGDAIIGLAEAYKYQQNTQKAKAYYSRYLKLHPDGPEASVARANLEQLK